MPRGLGALVVGHPQDPALSEGACVTTGQFASSSGCRTCRRWRSGMGLERDLALVEATGARYHADQISTAASLPALRARQGGGARR